MKKDKKETAVILNDNSLPSLVDASLAIEKIRVRSQVRQSHLALNGRNDIETDNLLLKLEELESYVDGQVAEHITSHPAYPWFSRIKGIGKENIGKVVAPIDIRKANTISALWKFAGYSVDNGVAPKRNKGDKLTYNGQLRTMCYRLAQSLLRARGKFYDYYLNEKDKYNQKYTNLGYKVVPASQISKKDGDGCISEGHIHNMALRKMIKLFLACLWLEWRKAEKLPVTKPYAIDQLKHDSFIKPEEMCDRD